MAIRAFVVTPGSGGCDETRFCYKEGDVKRENWAFNESVEAVRLKVDSLEKGEVVSVGLIDVDPASCAECLSEDCGLRQSSQEPEVESKNLISEKVHSRR